jgi:hypothetical protein
MNRLDEKGLAAAYRARGVIFWNGDEWLTVPALPKNVELPIIPILRGTA